uniref:Uncharacterized protein n=1 Tax=Arcella intermedia TaxID=1963864 RepID=A0A6B2LNB4_9EUKA
MKFMQRKKEEKEREESRLKRESAMKESEWVLKGEVKSSIILEEASLVNPNFGRRSFNNFNSKVETIYNHNVKAERRAENKVHQNKPKQPKAPPNEVKKEENDLDVDVAATEMANSLKPAKRTLSNASSNTPNKRPRFVTTQKK